MIECDQIKRIFYFNFKIIDGFESIYRGTISPSELFKLKTLFRRYKGGQVFANSPSRLPDAAKLDDSNFVSRIGDSEFSILVIWAYAYAAEAEIRDGETF